MELDLVDAKFGYRREFPICDFVTLVMDSELEPVTGGELVVFPGVNRDRCGQARDCS